MWHNKVDLCDFCVYDGLENFQKTHSQSVQWLGHWNMSLPKEQHWSTMHLITQILMSQEPSIWLFLFWCLLSLSLRAKFLNFFLFFPLKLSVTLISYRINSKFFNLASKSTYYWASVYISKLTATTPPPCSLPVDLMEPVIGPYSRAVLSHNVEYSSSQQLHIWAPLSLKSHFKC